MFKYIRCCTNFNIFPFYFYWGWTLLLYDYGTGRLMENLHYLYISWSIKMIYNCYWSRTLLSILYNCGTGIKVWQEKGKACTFFKLSRAILGQFSFFAKSLSWYIADSYLRGKRKMNDLRHNFNILLLLWVCTVCPTYHVLFL